MEPTPPLNARSPDLSHLPVPPSTIVYVQTPTACMHCGYSLQGLPINGACPECGVPIRQSAGPWSTIDDLPHMPQPVVITTPTTCVQCGYSLVGLRRDAACPECATPVARSLRPALLREKPIEFINRTRAGATWLLIASLLFVISGLAIVCFQLISFVRLLPEPLLYTALMPFVGFVMFVAWIAWVGGWWRLSAPDSSVVRPRTRVAMVLRIACWGQIGGMIAAMISLPMAATVSDRYFVAYAVASTGAFLAAFVSLPLGAYRLRQLATLIPDINLEVKITTLCRAILICLGVTLFSLAVGALVPVLGIAILCLSILAWFGVTLAFPICLASFRRAVDEELRQQQRKDPA